MGRNISQTSIPELRRLKVRASPIRRGTHGLKPPLMSKN